MVYLLRYKKQMIEVRQTEVFTRWFDGLRDRQVRARINVRIRRLSLGNFGDAKPVGEGVSELRIDFGPGYRVYFARRGRILVVLLAGGDKNSQDRDFKKAQKLAREL
jgi:putative addiction module killer protein